MRYKIDMTDNDDDQTNDDDNDDVEICVHFSHAGSSDSTYTYSAIFAEVEKKQIILHFQNDTFFPIDEVFIPILHKQVLLYSY